MTDGPGPARHGPVHAHGHVHQHGHAGDRSPRRVRVVLAAILAPVVVLTGIGLALLWPGQDERVPPVPVLAEGATWVRARVVDVLPERGVVEVDVDGGTLAHTPPEVLDGGVQVGDEVRLMAIAGLEDQDVPLVWVDHVREVPIGVLAAVYAALVVLVARWRGAAAVIGLGTGLWLIGAFTLPALVAGSSPLAVAVVTSSAAVLVMLYVAHGISARTTTAVLGTMLGLVLTAVLAAWATGAARLTGATSDEAMMLPAYAPDVTLRGVVLCGMVLAGLGVLNDVTITQASAVFELRAVAPSASRRELFTGAMRIGRDHIASTVYTIAFAYVGAALPALLLVSVLDQALVQTLTAGEIAEEVVRTLVGSIGLVAAIPLTTAIAAAVVPGARALPRHGDHDASRSPQPASTSEP